MSDHKLQQKDRVILIGEKQFIAYVTPVTYQFVQEGADEITIKARGKYTARAIDAAEVAAKKFLNGMIETTTVKIDSSEYETEGKKIRVSSIEIVLRKKK